jgi:ubiquinone/menaquinone biosynthesis C-methylase UbiE
MQDYRTVTEVSGSKASRTQLQMLYTRYRYAASFCEGKKVLEVACGPGLGLGYLQRHGATVTGGDVEEQLLCQARRHYGARIPLVCLDAHKLPFSAGEFDVVILYEAIYYLRDADGFLAECRRVLRNKGVVLLCTVNREWPEFNPSPFSVRYYGSDELRDLFQRNNFEVEIYHAFPVRKQSALNSVVSLIKRFAVRNHLIPRTMKGKEFLKRIFFGKLVPLPDELEDGLAEYVSPTIVAMESQLPFYQVLYAVGYLC